MKRSTNWTIFAAAALIALPSPHALAADAPTGEWTGEGELGYLRTSGNTDTQSLTAKLGIKREQDVWRHSGKLEATSKSDANVTTAERYYGAAKSDYKLDDRRYVYGEADYEEDHFSGYEYRINESLGMGYRFIDQPHFTLDLEAGPGARQSKRDDGTRENEATFRLGGNLLWKISETAELTEELTSTVGQDSTNSRSLTSLKTKINDAFAMKLSYLYKHSTSVPDGKKKSDTELAATLVYSF